MYYGWKPGANYDNDDLRSTVGYVTRLWVEQEDSVSTIRFRLQIFYETDMGTSPFEQDFILLPEENAAVAMAQFQLLQDALRSLDWDKDNANPFLVHVHFNFSDETLDFAFVHWLRLIAEPSWTVGTTVQQYSDVPAYGEWMWH